MKAVKVSKILMPFIALSAVFVLFQNCSQVDFNAGASKSENGVSNQSFPNGGVNDSTGLNIATPNPVDPSLINSNCANGVVKEKTFEINFPNPGVVCEWEEKGNLSILDHYFRARRKQTVDISLPETATICDAQFDFGAQEFWYDDVFILTLDSNVLVSSYNWDGVLARSNDFYQYDWQNVVGEFWDHGNKSEDFCEGKASGLSSCSFPAQHDTAPITLDIQPQLLRNAMANSGFIKHSFHFVTTGDNDSSDCQHFSMAFEVRIQYVD